MKPWARKLALLAVGHVVAVVAGEALLRVTSSGWSNYNTEMWRYATTVKQKTPDNPRLGHEHKPHATAQLYGTEIRTNSLGLREDREFEVPKPSGLKRLLVLGDSITLAWGVDVEDGFCARLDAALDGWEVINSGVGNYNSSAEAATYEKLQVLEPDAVMLAFYINDIEKPQYCSGLWCSLSHHTYYYPLLKDRLGGGTGTYIDYYTDWYERESDRLEADLDGVMTAAAQRDQPMVLVAIPELHSFTENPFPQVDALLQRVLARHPEVALVDLRPHLVGHEPKDLWVSQEDHHPNAEGHRLFAEGMLPVLVEVLP